LSPTRARLTYRQASNTLTVFVWAWTGPEVGPDRIGDEETGRSFVLVRTHDLGIAFEGGRAERDIWIKAAAAIAAELEQEGDDR
jgi:hypothetical protein